MKIFFAVMLKQPMQNVNKGFTLVELLLVMGIAATLMGFITINVTKAQRSTSVVTVADTLIADMKSQQIKAMNGTSVNTTDGDAYGVYFQTNNYVLFYGTTYDPFDSRNFIVDSDGSTVFSPTFPGNTVIFSQLTGEVAGFTPTANTITVKSLTGTEQLTIVVNRYGVVIDIN